MITQKILILGITGNLSKIKVLPSIGKYFAMHKNKINIELYGYSRSAPNLQEIKSIIASNSDGFLPYIELAQGSYSDNQFYYNLVDNLKSNESLTIYLALPPSVYLDFLQSSCSYGNKNINILIEKPFGENTEEAKKILEVSSTCQLASKIHFLDHYLFKSGTQVKFDQIGKSLNLQFSNLKTIKVQALETVDVKERSGYYDEAGAIKDMLPHLISLFRISLKVFGGQIKQDIFGSESVINYRPTRLIKSQYKDYKSDVNNANSNTETYFCANMEVQIDSKSIELVLESGKNQSTKITRTILSFEDGEELEYQIAPDPKFVLSKNNVVINEIPILSNFKDDHVIVFEDILQLNYDRFVEASVVLKYWEIFDRIIEFGKDIPLQVD